MYCPNCGENQEGNNFCFSCGKKLDFTTNIEPNLDTVVNKTSKTKSKVLRSGSYGWMIFGFIFALLGGPLGIAMGVHYAWAGKNYDSSTRKAGYIMMVVGIICVIILSNS